MKRISLKKQSKQIDKNLLICTLCLVLIGLVAVADASAPQAISNFSDRYYYFKQQAVWAGIGIILMLFVSKINYSFWQKLAVPIFMFSIVLLVAVLFPQVGVKSLGARRWIYLGGISIQPSEIIKFSLALYFAKLTQVKKSILAYLFPLALVSFLIMLQPDLGTTLIVVSIGIMQIFISGVSFAAFILTLITSGGLGLILILVSPYRRDRLLTFINQTNDPLGKSYHIKQVLLSLGLGGMFGVGLGASRQKYLFLPEAATDSIFAVVAEEIGFVGAFFLVVLFAYFIILNFKISLKAPDIFSKVVSFGIAVWIGGQILLNLGSMTALVPLTGVPLPFFSYGGSSLTMLLLATGILLNISRYASSETRRKK